MYTAISGVQEILVTVDHFAGRDGCHEFWVVNVTAHNESPDGTKGEHSTKLFCNVRPESWIAFAALDHGIAPIEAMESVS